MKKNISVLKGNFQAKKDVLPKTLNEKEEGDLSEKVKKRALASLGGSMVYMERKKRTWDGNV